METPPDEPPAATPTEQWPALPAYPWSAFDSRRWLESHRIPIIPRKPSETFKLHCNSEMLRCRLTSEWDRVRFDRIGVLRGEFVPLENGLMLLDNGGAYITVNFPEDYHVAHLPFRQANDPNLWTYGQSVREHWRSLPLVENGAVLSHIYHNNYYHFSMEFIQKFRLMENMGVTTIAIPPEMLKPNISRELMSLVLGQRKLVTTDQPMRLKDPVVVQAHQSDEALRWLRKLVGRTAAPGDKRYYIRRAPRPGHVRAANNIAETPRFEEFLRKHQFVPIDFGLGELSLHEQIGKLDGCSVLLAPHGAGFTNISYLNPPVRIIEVFGRGVLSSSFIRISEALGLEHHAVVAEEYDEAGNILVDCDLLDRLVLGQT